MIEVIAILLWRVQPGIGSVEMRSVLVAWSAVERRSPCACLSVIHMSLDGVIYANGTHVAAVIAVLRSRDAFHLNLIMVSNAEGGMRLWR